MTSFIMQNRRRQGMRYLLFLAATMLLLLPQNALAAVIGASPAQVTFGDVLRGGYAESDLLVSTNTDETLFGHLELAGDVAPWISFSSNSTSFNTSLNSPRTVTIIVQPPLDTPAGIYTGRLTVVADEAGGIAGRAGSVIKSSVILPLTVTVTGTQTVGCTAGSLELEDIEEGLPMVIWATIRNTGNVKLAPLITLSVWDSLQEKVVFKEELRGKEVLPTRTERAFATVEHSLGIGQYWADVAMPECDAESLLTFSVIEKGGIADKGELTEIKLPQKVAVGETVPVTAIFYNKGSRLVVAQFKGTVRKDGRVIDTISSDEVEVESGKVEQLVAYFVPKAQGRYTVTGRVVYNRKLTFEKSANTLTEGTAEKPSGLPAALATYAALTAVGFYFVRKLRARRRRRF